MANEKKFLDSSGISHLWDRIEERYPNMDELGLIIDAVDEAKADRTDLETLSSKVNEVENIANILSDWNLNDENDSAHIVGRTHWAEVTEIASNVLTWDGNIDGLIGAEIKNQAITYYKVSDVVLELSDLVGCIITSYEDSELNISHIQSDAILDMGDAFLVGQGEIVVIKKDNTSLENGLLIFPKAGIYFPDPLVGVFVSKLELPSSSTKTFVQTNEVIHKLDAKYLDLDWLPIKNTRQVIGETTVTNNLRVDIPYLDVFYSDNPRKYYITGTADVYFDGVLYTLPVHLVNFATYNTYFIGNLSLSRFISYPGLELVDTGEPFCIYSTTERDTASEIPYTEFYVNDDEEHTISVFAAEYNKIPEAYLPDTVANKEYVDTEITTAKKELTESIAETYQPKGEYLTEHQQIKTINGESLIGEGDVVIEGVKSWNDLEDRPFGENIDYVVVADEHVNGTRRNLQTNIPGYSNPDSIHFNGDKLIVGDTYIVTVDGVDYETIVLCSDDVNSGLPYFEVEAVTANVVKIPNGSRVVRLTFPLNITYRIKLTHVQKSVTTIDPKYLPDDIATKEYVDTEINKPKNYIMFIDQVNGYNYAVEMRNGNLVSRCTVSTIEVTTLPDITEYLEGEYLNTTGMVVTATCYDGNTFEITDYTYANEPLAVGENVIEISYTEYDMTYTTSFKVVTEGFNPEVTLIDFDYTANDDGTYTLTEWKQTLNGEPSTKMVIPDYSVIRL